MVMNLLDHPAMFQTPEFDPHSEWIEHIPFGMLLVDLIRPRSIVALGDTTGASYCAFCQTVQSLALNTHCVGIDTRQVRHSSASLDDGYERLRDHHDARYTAFSQLLRMTSDEAALGSQNGAIDLLHLAGSHTYDTLSHDVHTWLPKMSSRGVILVDDIAERCDGSSAWHFWDELSQRYPSFSFEHGRGLGLVCVGSEIPADLRFLFELSDTQKAAFRSLCRDRGAQLHAAQVGSMEIVAPDKHDPAMELLAYRFQAAEGTIGRLKLHEAQAISARVETEERILSLNHTVNLQALRIQALTRSLDELAWLDVSRGARLIKLARAARHLRRQHGAGYVLRRIAMWMGGARGQGMKVVESSAPSASERKVNTIAPTTPPTDGAFVREQHLPPNSSFSGVSVVIPVFNALDYALKCVTSIYTAASQIPFEIIVVDNGSQPEALDWLRREASEHDNFWYISVSNNLGYAAGMNLGIKYARGEYLMLSNSDILATPHWLDRLVSAMETDERIGVLSPLTNYVGHGPQVDTRAADLRPQDIDDYAADISGDETLEKVVNRLVFFCVMVRRDVVSLLGGLSESYGLGNYEDDDFCLRTRLAGYTLAIARNTFVYHFGTKTFSANKIDHTGFMLRNQIRFLDMASNHSTEITSRTLRRSVKRPLVSVIVRTVNRPQTLSKALTSLANQTLDNFEVVVVNDGGPDLAQFLAAFQPYLSIRYVHNTRSQGRSEALNIGVEHASGKYITYLDDDDIAYPTHLETLVTTIEQDPEGFGVAYTDYNRALMSPGADDFTTVSRMPSDTWAFRYDHLLVTNYLPIHTWMHDRDVWVEVGGFDTSLDMLEDWDFLIRIAQRRNFLSAGQITCEYRFYLSGANSIVNNRMPIVHATQAIHARYLATPEGDVRRKALVTGLVEQIAEGDRILKSDEIDGQPSEAAVRRLLQFVVGFSE